MIETLENVLAYLGIQNQYIIVNAANNILKLKYNNGAVTDVTITSGTYTCDTLASTLKTLIDAALTCTSTVTWSSTTKKFTIAVAANTIAYTHAGSTAGLTIGLNADKAASASIASDIAVGDPTAVVSKIHNGIEAWVKKKYCRREFESATFKEAYDGTGEDCLFLKQYPVTDVLRVALGKVNVISIKNINKATSATVTVNDTGLILYYNGVADSTITFALNTTVGAVVAAINALSANGWYAETIGDYADYLSTELRKVYGLNAIDENYVYLTIPDKTTIPFEVYTDEGVIETEGGWPQGHNNIFVDYIAGYSVADMPDDLKLAICILTKFIHQRTKEESFGLKNYSIDGISQTFVEDGIPTEARRTLDSYKNVSFG